MMLKTLARKASAAATMMKRSKHTAKDTCLARKASGAAVVRSGSGLRLAV